MSIMTLTENKDVKFHMRKFFESFTSKTPRQRPSLPITPASSRTSRIAVTDGSSSGSTPPPGTIQLSGRLEDVTSNTCAFETRFSTPQADALLLSNVMPH